MPQIKELKIKILSYIDDSQFGRLKCCFSDIYESVHYIEDKVPVITEMELSEKSEYPQNGQVRCRVISINDKIITVDISNPFSLEDQNGETIFEVFSSQLE